MSLAKLAAKRLFCVLTIILAAVTVSCSSGGGSTPVDPVDPPSNNTFITNVIFESSVEVIQGSSFTVGGTGFASGDKLYFRPYASATAANDIEATISQVLTSGLKAVYPTSGLSNGIYKLVVKRGAKEQIIATVTITLSTTFGPITPSQGTTVYGRVYSGTTPLSDVVVSDGYIVTKTNSQGIYELATNKAHGYVFVSLPSGYDATVKNSIPQFFKYTTKDATLPEQLDFSLTKVSNDNFSLVISTDIHLANRTRDLSQYRSYFIPDVTSTVNNDLSGRKVYALCLGDMTWDGFWYTNSYDLNNYKTEISGYPLPIFHVQGNHDNDPQYKTDWEAESAYKRIIGPTYYSVNIGKIHLVVLDNVVYKNLNDRDYDKYITDAQMNWLKADLATITDKSTPVIVGMHCPVYRCTGWSGTTQNVTYSLSSSTATNNLAACFTGFSDVRFLTGHTHKNSVVTTSGGIMEQNIAAACATWWWTGYYNEGINICKDGSPGGYSVFNIDNKTIKWYYKGIGKPKTYQFRCYDMNVVPSANGGTPGNNELLINVWNWDSQWKVEVTENGNQLTVTPLQTKDPLHMIAYTGSTSDFITDNNYHFFKVTAASATSTLIVKVTDRFGTVYTQNVTRPKTFNVSMD